MGEHLDRYRRAVCEAEDHAHGEDGMLDCLLLFIITHRAKQQGES